MSCGEHLAQLQPRPAVVVMCLRGEGACPCRLVDGSVDTNPVSADEDRLVVSLLGLQTPNASRRSAVVFILK